MTKIYVVTATDYKENVTWISEVFTNKAKAKAYLEWVEKVNQNYSYHLEDCKICTFDYNQLKELPF